MAVLGTASGRRRIVRENFGKAQQRGEAPGGPSQGHWRWQLVGVRGQGGGRLGIVVRKCGVESMECWAVYSVVGVNIVGTNEA